MLASKFFRCLGLLFALHLSTSGYTWPDPETDILEAIYYQQIGHDERRFGVFVRTCDAGATNLGPGRTNAAEWVRTAYHDMATADVEAGTGGIDASIGFERARPENVGKAFTDTLLFFENFMSIRSSMADLIALGAIMSITACTISTERKPIYLPFRAGRVDATKPGPAGVPEPHQNLLTHKQSFKKQGFNETEMIALVACGHSLGGINGRDFPEIVPVKNDSVPPLPPLGFGSVRASYKRSSAANCCKWTRQTLTANNTLTLLSLCLITACKSPVFRRP